MNRDTIELEIGQLLSDFSDKFRRAKNYKSIPQIEVDLMLASVRNLYDQIYKLNNFTSIQEHVPEAAMPEVQEQSMEVIENIAHVKIDSTVSPDANHKKIVHEELKTEDVIVLRNVLEETQVVNSVKRETVFIEQSKTQLNAVGNLFDDMPTIAGNYKEQPSLHHKIGNTKTERYSDKLQQQPVADLKRSIGINEKFAFMNELFAGDQQKYNQSIETLNGFSDYDTAQAHLNELASVMKWNTNAKTFNELDNLVKRRFGV